MPPSTMCSAPPTCPYFFMMKSEWSRRFTVHSYACCKRSLLPDRAESLLQKFASSSAPCLLRVLLPVTHPFPLPEAPRRGRTLGAARKWGAKKAGLVPGHGASPYSSASDAASPGAADRRKKKIKIDALLIFFFPFLSFFHLLVKIILKIRKK